MAEMVSSVQHSLVQLAISGEHRAFDKLYRLWYRRWYRFALRQCRSAETAEDLVQSAVLEMVRNIGRLRDPQSFVSWSFVILRRCCAMHVRRKVTQREHDRCIADDATLEEVIVPEDPRLTDLSVAMTSLSADQQDLLTLFYSYGLTVAELAGVFAVAPGTIKSRLYHLRETLKEKVLTEEEISDV